MSAAAHWVRAGEEAPMERAALGKLIASCPGHDLTTLDKPGEPGEAGEKAAPVVVAAGEWQIEMPTDSSIIQAMLDEMSADSMRAMLQKHGSLETRGMRSEVMGKLAALLLPNEEWCAEQRVGVRAAAIEQAKAKALSAFKAAKAAAAADLAHTRREIAWFHPAKVVKAMHIYMEEIDVQEKACVALGSLVLDVEHRARVARAGGIDAVVAAMREHPGSEALQERACCALAHLSDGDPRGCAAIARAGGLVAVAEAMRAFGSVAALQRWACAVFAHTLDAAEDAAGAQLGLEPVEAGGRQAIVDAGGVGLLLTALKTLPKDGAVQRECCAALAALAQHTSAARAVMVSRGAVDAALASIRKHLAQPGVVAEACLLLGTLTAGDADVKRALVDAEAVGTICLALSEHPSDPWLQTQGLTVLWVLMVDPTAIDPTTGLVNGVHVGYRRLIETAGGGELAEAARVRFSGIPPEPEESVLIASLTANDSAWAQMPSLSLTLPGAEADAAEGGGDDDGSMRLVIEEWKDEQGQLNLLLAKAKALNHPGIDDEGIATMREFIDSERFSRGHYIEMWTKRLEGLGVMIVRVPRGEEVSGLMREGGDESRRKSSAGSAMRQNDTEISSIAAATSDDDTDDDDDSDDEEEEEEEEGMLMRDDDAVRAAEGVLQKLHEGDPDPKCPWTAPVPMVKPEETIYLWNDEDLINHSATSHIEQLQRVETLDNEAAELRAKLKAAGFSAPPSEAGKDPTDAEAAAEGVDVDTSEDGPVTLTKRRRDMSVAEFEAAEAAAAEQIKARLAEIKHEQKVLASTRPPPCPPPCST